MMMELQPIELKGIRVLTTKQIADCYETKVKVIGNNFSRNRDRYIIGKHYFYLEGKELCKLKTDPQFDGQLKHTSKALFWTEKGALLHAKSLNTDKAWEVYDYLVDFYFRVKEGQTAVALDQMYVGSAADLVDQTIKEATDRAYRSRIGFCRAIVNEILEKERGDKGSILAVLSLLSDEGKRKAMEMIGGEVRS